MKRTKAIKITLFIFFNALFIADILWAAIIYTSLMSDKLPWYDPCGMQFIIILALVCPVLIFVGVFQLLFGKILKTSLVTRILPFVSCLALAIPIFADGGLGYLMQVTGVLITIITIVVIGYFSIPDLKRIIKSE
jgi:hypothetical protein